MVSLEITQQFSRKHGTHHLVTHSWWTLFHRSHREAGIICLCESHFQVILCIFVFYWENLSPTVPSLLHFATNDWGGTANLEMVSFAESSSDKQMLENCVYIIIFFFFWLIWQSNGMNYLVCPPFQMWLFFLQSTCLKPMIHV